MDRLEKGLRPAHLGHVGLQRARNRLPNHSQEDYGPSGRGLCPVHLGNVSSREWSGTMAENSPCQVRWPSRFFWKFGTCPKSMRLALMLTLAVALFGGATVTEGASPTWCQYTIVQSPSAGCQDLRGTLCVRCERCVPCPSGFQVQATIKSHGSSCTMILSNPPSPCGECPSGSIKTRELTFVSCQ